MPDRGTEDSSSGWVFTSNNNGTGPSAGGGNAKIRGNHDIPRRQQVAIDMNKVHACSLALRQAHARGYILASQLLLLRCCCCCTRACTCMHDENS
jgi:hypothetical protein